MVTTHRLPSRSPRAAARQCGALFALAGVVTLPGILSLPERASLLLAIGAADLVCALVAWTLPWQQWSPLWPATLSVPAFMVIALATWTMGGYISGTAPFLLLVFVWVGLNFPPWVTWAITPLGTIAYVVPLVASQTERVVIGSVFVMMPVVVGIALLVGRQIAAVEAARDDAIRLARTDGLTHLRNRLALNDDLEAIHARAIRNHSGYAVALFDVDFFKRYNDSQGHLAGDEVLRQVAAIFTTNTRKADLVYRYGGEEFLVLLSDQDLASAVIGAERVRAAVEAQRMPHPHGLGGVVTVSVGVAAFTAFHPQDPDAVLRHADDALYRAKETGRNRVCAPAPRESLAD
ncbi:GGDEF domain-containing protein [Lentzea nigeriaca]|uniref:GGDEF domain-containing protein n=1 Tax=Lentzea nigeriaca TaxID=1128665 RepID=UPI00195A59D7|nr:GGDEF domain-containing protein [Lentzea nigeriaca]MBM7864594.1 diguanylate cyclase (GGDEF)-like protein [Lentzea nigeriaca]